MNILLYPDQVERLKENRYGAATLRYAYKRYLRGDFGAIEVRKETKKEKRANSTRLVPFTIKNRFPVSNEKMREILRMHFEYPDEDFKKETAAEIARLDRIIEESFNALSGVKYIEKQQEK